MHISHPLSTTSTISRKDKIREKMQKPSAPELTTKTEYYKPRKERQLRSAEKNTALSHGRIARKARHLKGSKKLQGEPETQETTSSMSYNHDYKWRR